MGVHVGDLGLHELSALARKTKTAGFTA